MDISKIKENLNKPEIEIERKSRLKNLVVTEIVILCILSGGGYLFKLFTGYLTTVTRTQWHNWIAVLLLFILFILIVTLFTCPYVENKDFKIYLKEKCVNQIKKLFNLEKKDTGFTEKSLEDSNLFSNFTKIENDDIFHGTFGDITYTVSETNLISKGRKHEFSVFKGIIISLPANKNFKSKTVITTKADANVINNIPYLPLIIASLVILALAPVFGFVLPLLKLVIEKADPTLIMMILGFVGLFIFTGLIPIALVVILGKYKKEKFEKAKTEDVLFEKRFKIHAQDQVEARYLVTTGFMERLNELKLAFGTKNIKCSFFDNKVMIAIETNRDLFELGTLYKPCPTDKDIRRFYDEILAIQKLITHLKLTDKTGL